MHTQEWEQKIRERAYEIYLDRNGLPGSEMEDWLQAEAELLEDGDAAVEDLAAEPVLDSDAREN